MIAPTMQGEHRGEHDGSRWVAVGQTSGAIVAAIIGPSDESGPSTRILDGPNNA